MSPSVNATAEERGRSVECPAEVKTDATESTRAELKRPRPTASNSTERILPAVLTRARDIPDSFLLRLQDLSEPLILWSQSFLSDSPNLTSLLSEPIGDKKNIRTVVHELFSIYRHEIFEPGLESPFYNELSQMLENNPDECMRAILESIQTILDGGVVSEAMKVIGHTAAIDNTNKVRALVRGLRHRSRIARDAAAVALSDIGDASSIPALKEAIEKESVPELKNDLRHVLQSIEKG